MMNICSLFSKTKSKHDDVINKIRRFDYVTLKSIEEVKPVYNHWNVLDNGEIIAGNPCIDYFTPTMKTAMDSSEKYRVEVENKDNVWVNVWGQILCFSKICVKDVYRITKVS